MTSENPAKPSRDNFDFSAYVQGKSTFPTFKHTVYLDQANGIALVKAADEYTELAERVKEIEKIRNAMSEQAYTPLVSDEADELYVEQEEKEARIAELDGRISDLKEKVYQSGLTLHFQVGTADRLAEIVRKAEKEFLKTNKRGSDDDPEYMTKKAKFVLARQLGSYCTEVELPDGTKQDPPGVEGFTSLLNALISSESVRLLSKLNEALDSSVTWEHHVDAGFPRGGSDVAGEPVGGLGAEDGKVLVDPAALGPDGDGRDVG